MTLSSWFRDYIYLPLGGNRVKTARYIFNILVVWMLTGFWHGADWNFILWGAYFGIVLLIEKLFLSKALLRMPGFAKHVYVMLIVFVSWAFFDSTGISMSFETIGRIFGFGVSGFTDGESLYYLRSYAIPFAIGIIGTTPLIKTVGERIAARKFAGLILEPALLALVLIAATASMVEGSFNPFIYFRF
jgi:alginate O-acetyltransferase complex protein AlgI